MCVLSVRTGSVGCLVLKQQVYVAFLIKVVSFCVVGKLSKEMP